MATKRRSSLKKTSGASDQEELESLNAETRAQRNVPQMIRRSMEAQIEDKSKLRRQGERPASAGARKRVA